MNILYEIVEEAIKNNHSIFLYRLPEENTIHVLSSSQHKKDKPNLNEEGFIVSPFYNPDLQETLFFYHEKKTEIHISNIDIKHEHIQHYHTDNLINKSTKKEYFENIVNKAISEIQKNNLHKVVNSKTKTVFLPKTFDLIKSFITLTNTYPFSFCCMASSPIFGTWLGASPETLIEINNNILTTMALAGTQPKTETDIRKAQWTQKEIEEQALVSRYIINCFKKIRLREFEEIGPRTIETGHLLHLQTKFIINLEETEIENLPETLLNLLHPTSAVCGMPVAQARSFLKENEAHDRKLYTGFWGPVNLNKKTHLFVNLRTSELHNDVITYYAGAGITADSIAEREWLETEYKTQIVAKAIEKQMHYD